MIPYTIIHFDTDTQQVTVRLKDLLGHKHDLAVPAEGLMNHEIGNYTGISCGVFSLFLRDGPSLITSFIFGGCFGLLYLNRRERNKEKNG